MRARSDRNRHAEDNTPTGTRVTRSLALALGISAAALASGCGKKAPPKMPPIVVEVTPVVQKDKALGGGWNLQPADPNPTWLPPAAAPAAAASSPQ